MGKPNLQLYMKQFPLKNLKNCRVTASPWANKRETTSNEQERLRHKLTMKPTRGAVTYDEEGTQNLKLLPEG